MSNQPPDPAYVAELEAREAFIRRQYEGRLFVSRDDIFRELTRQGMVEWYLHPQWFHDTALQDWYIFTHEISDKSGIHRHQGGLVLFAVSGHGYTLMDGERHEWEAGDLILLPMKPGGIEHQHFNLSSEGPAVFLALISQTMYDQGGSEMVQGEFSAEFLERFGQGHEREAQEAGA